MRGEPAAGEMQPRHLHLGQCLGDRPGPGAGGYQALRRRVRRHEAGGHGGSRPGRQTRGGRVQTLQRHGRPSDPLPGAARAGRHCPHTFPLGHQLRAGGPGHRPRLRPRRAGEQPRPLRVGHGPRQRGSQCGGDGGGGLYGFPCADAGAFPESHAAGAAG